MRVTVRLFARLRDIAGAAEIARDVAPGATIGSVWRQLAGDFPELAVYERSISSAVNADYARMDYVLRDGDEVAFLPPVSGGSDRAGGLGSGCVGAALWHRRTQHQSTLEPNTKAPSYVGQVSVRRAAIRRAGGPPRDDRGAGRSGRVPEALEGRGRDCVDRRALQGIQGAPSGGRADRGPRRVRGCRHARARAGRS